MTSPNPDFSKGWGSLDLKLLFFKVPLWNLSFSPILAFVSIPSKENMGGETGVSHFIAVLCQQGISTDVQSLYRQYLTMAHLFALKAFYLLLDKPSFKVFLSLPGRR